MTYIKPYSKAYKSFLFLFGLMVLLAGGCSTGLQELREPETDEVAGGGSGQHVPTGTDLNAEEGAEQNGIIPLSNPRVMALFDRRTRNEQISIRGKALLQISEPGQSERLQMEFSGTSTQNHILLKTSLGIPAAKIYTDPDSLLIHHLTEKFVEIVGRDKMGAFAGQNSWVVPASGNLLDIVNPTLAPEDVLQIVGGGVARSDTADEPVRAGATTEREGLGDKWTIYLKNGEIWTVKSSDGSLLRRERFSGALGQMADAIDYRGSVLVDGQIFPRRVVILNKSSESRILVQIRELTIHENLILERPAYPESTAVYRL